MPDDPALPIACDALRLFESLKLAAYPDPASGGAPWTIAYGSTRIDGRPVAPGDHVTQAQADAMLAQQAADVLARVRAMLAIDVTPAQAAALTSFAYNEGTAALRGSTLLRRLNTGQTEAVPDELHKWVYAAGRVQLGLLRRRWAEAAIWRGLPPAAAQPLAWSNITAIHQWPPFPTMP